MFDFSTFPTLMTDRLILREFQVEDFADLFAFQGLGGTEIQLPADGRS